MKTGHNLPMPTESSGFRLVDADAISRIRRRGRESTSPKRTVDRILAALQRHHGGDHRDLIRMAYRTARIVHFRQFRKTGEPFLSHPLEVALLVAEQGCPAEGVAAAILHDTIEDDHRFRLVREAFREVADPDIALLLEDLSFQLTRQSTGPALNQLLRGIDRTQMREQYGLAAVRAVDEIAYSLYRRRFGEEVAGIVVGLTKLQREEMAEPGDAKRETLLKLLAAAGTDYPLTLVIKCFDRLANLQTLEVYKPLKRQAIAEESLRFYVPIASRMGFFKQAREMEDHVMRVLRPDAYDVIERWLRKEEGRIRRRAAERLDAIKDALGFEGIRYRVKLYHKGVHTIFHELERQGLGLDALGSGCDFNLLFVVDDVRACFVTLQLVHEHFTHLPTRFRDFIHNPKINGYESLHTIVTGEDLPRIQVLIRTPEMNDANHRGVLSAQGLESMQAEGWVRDLVDSIRGSAPDAMLARTAEVYSAEIDVLTPHGESRKLPEGAVALDFAYQIHSGVGRHARAAVINGKPARLSDELRSGDQVRIVKDDDKAPEARQLLWVKTDRARNAITRALQRRERDEIAEELLAFRARYGLLFDRDLEPGAPAFRALLRRLSIGSEQEFGRQLLAGLLDPPLLLLELCRTEAHERLLPDAVISELSRKGLIGGVEARALRKIDVISRRHKAVVTLLEEVVEERDEADGVLELVLSRRPRTTRAHPRGMVFAECCRPGYGDRVVAWSTPARAMIHRRECSQVRPWFQLAQRPARLIRAEWSRAPREAIYRLQVSGVDRDGLVCAVTSYFADRGIGLRSLSMGGDKGLASGQFEIALPETKRLSKVVRDLARIEGVDEVVESARR